MSLNQTTWQTMYVNIIIPPSIHVSQLWAIVQAFYAQKGPFTKKIATEGFSTVFGQLMSPL